MEVKKITSEMLHSLIKEAAEKIKQEIQEESAENTKKELQEGDITKVGDPIDVKMNKNDGTEDKDAALVHKSKDKTEYKKGPAEKGEVPTDVKMNEQPSKEGSDEKAATAVAVKAGAEKGGNDYTTGQHKANFESKTDGPKDSVSVPFDKKASDKMNSQDKEIDEGAKTYVEAGAEKSGTDNTAGQHKANWKEDAPKSDNDKRIATGIQLKESYTKQELQEFISSEAKKLAKKQLLEIELNKLKEEISKI